MFYKMIENKCTQWYESEQCTVKNLIEYILDEKNNGILNTGVRKRTNSIKKRKLCRKNWGWDVSRFDTNWFNKCTEKCSRGEESKRKGKEFFVN